MSPWPGGRASPLLDNIRDVPVVAPRLIVPTTTVQEQAHPAFHVVVVAGPAHAGALEHALQPEEAGLCGRMLIADRSGEFESCEGGVQSGAVVAVGILDESFCFAHQAEALQEVLSPDEVHDVFIVHGQSGFDVIGLRYHGLP